MFPEAAEGGTVCGWRRDLVGPCSRTNDVLRHCRRWTGSPGSQGPPAFLALTLFLAPRALPAMFPRVA